MYTLATGERERVRAVVREMLGVLTGCAPDSLDLYTGPKGKPLLRTDPALHFSVSHSHGVSLVALTRVAPVGVDVERIRPLPNAAAILRRFFSEPEVAEILGAAGREYRFVRAWTRAEATVKVRGASVWEAATPDPSVTVRAVEAPDGFAATVAVAAPVDVWHVVQRAWEG